MPRSALNGLFDRFNRTCFQDRLPQFVVRKDFKAEAPGYCDVKARVIHVPVDTKDVEVLVLHEMVHMVTGGAHDAAFRRELRRIARLGEPAAVRELASEE